MRRGLAVLAGAALLVFTGVAITQPPDKDGPPKEKKKGPGKGYDPFMKAIKGLDLTAAQKPKVAAIQEAHEQKLRELFKKMFAARKKLHDETLKELQGVLTEKQIETLEDALKKGPPPFEKKPPPGDKKGDDKDKDKKKDDKEAAVRQLHPRLTAAAFVGAPRSLS